MLAPGCQQRGAAEKIKNTEHRTQIKRETDVHLRQLAKKQTRACLIFLFFFCPRFWAFLSFQQGKFKNAHKKIEEKSCRKLFFSKGILKMP
jgi:hypothetical protein